MSSFVYRFAFLLFLTAGVAAAAQPHDGEGPGFQAEIPLGELLREDGTLDLSSGRSGAISLDGYDVMIGEDGQLIAMAEGAPANAASAAGSTEGAWSALGSGAGGAVLALAWAPDGALYVGGQFTSAGGVAGTNYVARWTPEVSGSGGGAWSALGSGVGSTVTSLAWGPDGALYAGGGFISPASRIARWTPDGTATGGTWSALGSGVNSVVRALAWGPDGALYVGGEFTSPVSRIARWTPDGTATGGTWSALGSGMNNGVFALAWGPDGALYVGGFFTSAGGVSASRIARWTPDGTASGGTWSALGSGVSNFVWALAWGPDGALYAGGGFTSAGGVAGRNSIARWTPDGTATGGTWSALGSGVNNVVLALAWGPDGALYAGGQFTSAGAVSGTSRIARWTPDGSGSGGAWTALGSGVNDLVYALAWGPDAALYAGGGFTSASGTGANRIARWTPPVCHTAASGNWSDPATWSACRSDTPGADEVVLIPAGITVTVDEPASVGTLTVEGTLIAEDALTINKHLALEGAITIGGGAVVLASGPTGRDNGVTIATFSDAGGTLTGDLTYERYYAHAERGWRMIGTPFAGVPFTSLNDDFHTQGAANADFTEGDPILFRFDAETDQWQAVADYAEIATPGEGYIFYMFDSYETTQHLPGRWTITGQENASGVAPPLHYDGVDDTFNLVSNPFAGPLDWHAAHDAATNVGSTYYVWETLGFEPGVGSTGVYRSYHRTGGGDAGQYIAPFQSFWVYADAAAPSMTLTHAMKDVEASPVIVGRPGGDGEGPLADGEVASLTLALEGEGLVATRPTALFHQGEASLDAPYLWPLAAAYAAVYFSDTDGRSLLYAGAGHPHEAEVSLPLHFEATRAGSYTLTWPEWNGVPESWQLALIDHETDVETDLREASAYAFVHAVRGSVEPGEALVPGAPHRTAGNARFTLVARTGPVSTEDNGGLPTTFAFESTYPNPFAGRSTLRFAVPHTAEVTIIAYDLLGRAVTRIADEEFAPGIHELSWDATGLAAGVYLVHMTGDDFSQTRRVVIVR